MRLPPNKAINLTVLALRLLLDGKLLLALGVRSDAVVTPL